MKAGTVKSEGKLLLKHSAVYGLATALNRMVGFFMIPIYTAYLTTADYGVMELLYTTTALIQMVVGVGIAHGVVRFYFDSDLQSERNKVISSAFFAIGALVVPIVVLLVFSADFLARVVLDDLAYSSYFVLAFVAMGTGMLNEINIAYLRAEKRSGTIVIASVSQLLLNVSLNIYFIVYQGMGVAGIFWAGVISSGLSLAVITPIVLSRVGCKVSFPVIKGLFKFGLPLIPSNIATYLVVASDRYFIKEFVSMGQTGVYSLGYKFGGLVNNFVTSPFNQIYGPRRLELYKNPDSRPLFGKIFTYFVFVLVVGGLAISLVAQDLVKLMAEPSYWDAYKIVPLLTLAHILLAFFYHFNIGITFEKKTKYFAYINLSNAAINLALNFMLIPKYGIWGAAWATFFCYLYRASLCYWFSNRLHKIFVEWRRVLIVFAVAFGFYFAADPLDLGHALINIAVKLGIGCAFPLVLYAARFFNPEEKAYARDVWLKIRRRLPLG